MRRGYTDINQSEKLLELGLDSNTADMCYVNDAEYIGKIEYVTFPFVLADNEELGKTDLPCWSLAALLDLMPIFEDITHYMEYPTIRKNDKGYFVYIGIRSSGFPFYETAIDAAFHTIIWLIEQGYIKTEKK